MKIKSVLSFLLITAILISCGGEKSQDQPEPKKGETTSSSLDYSKEVSFINENGDLVSTVSVAVADEPEERNQGLMNVTDLPSDAGMIFIFPDEASRSFWMANTPLSLDIVFVNADSSIVRIHHSTIPYSDQQLVSGQPAMYVVETNGGYCVNNDIKEGMKIRF